MIAHHEALDNLHSAVIQRWTLFLSSKPCLSTRKHMLPSTFDPNVHRTPPSSGKRNSAPALLPVPRRLFVHHIRNGLANGDAIGVVSDNVYASCQPRHAGLFDGLIPSGPAKDDVRRGGIACKQRCQLTCRGQQRKAKQQAGVHCALPLSPPGFDHGYVSFLLLSFVSALFCTMASLNPLKIGRKWDLRLFILSCNNISPHPLTHPTPNARRHCNLAKHVQDINTII